MGDASVAIEVAAGEGLVRRRWSWAQRAAASRDLLIGLCLLAVAFGAAFVVRAATGAHLGSGVKATFVGPVVQAPVDVVTTNQIPAAPPLELPKLARHPARPLVSHHRATVQVTNTAVVTAPVTHSTVAPPTSTAGSSSGPSVAAGPAAPTGSGTGDGSVSPPSTPAPTHSGTPSTSGGSSSGTSSGGGGSSNSGTVNGGG
jgi:hypothetical protein